MMRRDFALQDAQHEYENAIRPFLAPLCERIELAGSVRREKPRVKDIEVLVIPKVSEQFNMFGEPAKADDLLYSVLQNECAGGDVWEKRPSITGRYSFGRQNKLLIHKPSGIPVDIFSADAENWGMAMVVRTGPKEFNTAIMSRFRELRMRGHAYGGVTKIGPHGREGSEREEIACPDEETVFQLLGWKWIHPTQRAMVGRREYAR